MKAATSFLALPVGLLLIMSHAGCGLERSAADPAGPGQKVSKLDTTGGAPCDYMGVTYQDGETFDAGDECNDCTCNNGVVECTARPCVAPFWYYTCGDPVCHGHTSDPNIPDCTTEQPGDFCDPIGAVCDPQDDCNARLRCTRRDPRMQPGGCPISRAEYKRDIQYLSPMELEAYGRELLHMRLATYRYKAAGPNGARQLGFIIDDVGDSVCVNPDHETVNLYGYTSMAVAALKTQAEHITRLEKEMAELKARLDALSRSSFPIRKR